MISGAVQPMAAATPALRISARRLIEPSEAAEL